MKFDEMQEKEIYEFLLKYNQDEEFRNDVERKYNEEIHELSILYIYALEEIIRFGKKNIFNNYIKINDSESNLEFYDMFMNRLTHDVEFSKSKIFDMKNVTNIEAFIIQTFLKCVADKNNFEIKVKTSEELNYDPLNKLAYSNDEELKETIKNSILGANIHSIVDKIFPFLKKKQYKSGQFSKESKAFLTDFLRAVIPDLKDDIEKKAAFLLDVVKANLALGGAKELLEIFNKYNTNISYEEVYGKNKDLKK